jgi:serine/threonine protein phosphatase PrpC
MSVGKMLKLVSAAKSHQGAIRAVNEDAFLDRPDLGIWVVADGVGGHDAGEFASHLIVESLGNLAAQSDVEALAEDVRVALGEANRQLRAASAAAGHIEPIGSTVVALIAVGHSGCCLWAGDSRLYRLRGTQLRQISRDHSEVEELVASGVLSRDQARGHPSSRFITRAVGATDDFDLETERVFVDLGDTFLLCSDGLSKSVSDEEIASILATADCSDAVHALIHLALVREAADNVTAIAVRCIQAEPDAIPAG